MSSNLISVAISILAAAAQVAAVELEFGKIRRKIPRIISVSCQTSVMNRFYEISDLLKTVKCFRKKLYQLLW